MKPIKRKDAMEDLEQSQESAEAPHRVAPADVSGALAQADQLIAHLAQLPDGDLVGEIVETAVKLLRDRTNRGDIKLINKSMKEMRYALKVFSPYRDVRKVSIFGSARTPETDPDYKAAEEFARKMAAIGWMVMTGAGGGIMAAGHGGAGADPSFGLAIRLPFEQETNVHIARDKKLINFKYFFTRKLLFVRAASAVAMFPGGFGTLDESFEVLTLVQTGKSVPVPIVFVDRPGGTYWKAWLDYNRRQLLKRGFVSDDDFALFKVTDDVDEAIAEITRFYSDYHSLRYARRDLILRLHRPVTSAQLADIGRRFGDISEGPFRTSGPLSVEKDEPGLAHLHRLVFPFNKRDQGRLRMLIDHLNGL